MLAVSFLHLSLISFCAISFSFETINLLLLFFLFMFLFSIFFYLSLVLILLLSTMRRTPSSSTSNYVLDSMILIRVEERENLLLHSIYIASDFFNCRNAVEQREEEKAIIHKFKAAAALIVSQHAELINSNSF